MNAYLPEWVDVETRAGTVEAITFVGNIDGPLNAGGLSEQAIAEVVATAQARSAAASIISVRSSPASRF